MSWGPLRRRGHTGSSGDMCRVMSQLCLSIYRARILCLKSLRRRSNKYHLVLGPGSFLPLNHSNFSLFPVVTSSSPQGEGTFGQKTSRRIGKSRGTRAWGQACARGLQAAEMAKLSNWWVGFHSNINILWRCEVTFNDIFDVSQP